MAGFRIEGNTSGNVGEVDAGNNIKVTLPTTSSAAASYAGFALLAAEQDDGTITGNRHVHKAAISDNSRLLVSRDRLAFSDQFPGAAINSALWQSPVTTATVTVAGNLLNLNAAASTASGAVARVQTYEYFPTWSVASCAFEASVQFAQTPVTNNISEWGLGIATGVAAPTDGIFFRLNAAGEFRGVVNTNGSEVQTGTISFASTVGANTARRFRIEVYDDTVYFKVEGIVVGQINLPTAGPAMTGSASLPVLLRTYNTAVTGSAQVMKLGSVAVLQCGVDAVKPFPHQQCGSGMSAYQGQTGGTMGSTALYANSANPTAAVPTNTTAALGSGLGGQFWETDTLAVTTDGVISSFQNPAGTAALPGRTLHITGVTISSHIQTALTGGGYVASWSLAFGHTAVSLATAEASGSSTKAPRRVPLGFQTVAAAAAALTLLNTVSVNFGDAPIVVNPGEFVQTVKKKIGTAPSAGVVAHLVTFTGYYE